MSVSNQEFVGRAARVQVEDCMGFWIRLAAFLIDLILVFALFIIFGLGVGLADLAGVSVFITFLAYQILLDRHTSKCNRLCSNS